MPLQPYEILSSYYHIHWEEYSLDYCNLIQRLFTPDELPGSLADLGCGTGHITRRMRNLGYDCYGVDASGSMIAIARQRQESDHDRAGELFFQADIRNLVVPRPTSAAFLAYDVINYLIGANDLSDFLDNLRTQLGEPGYLVFDMNTPRIYQIYDGVDEEIAIPNGSIIQSTRYLDKAKMGHTEFIISQGDRVVREEHLQRVFTIPEMKRTLRSCGFHVKAILDDFDGSPARRSSQKPIFFARKE